MIQGPPFSKARDELASPPLDNKTTTVFLVESGFALVSAGPRIQGYKAPREEKGQSQTVSFWEMEHREKKNNASLQSNPTIVCFSQWSHHHHPRDFEKVGDLILLPGGANTTHTAFCLLCWKLLIHDPFLLSKS